MIGGRTGYGVLVCDNEKVLATCQGRLPNGCSIFQAEGAGLRAALQYLMTNAANYDAADVLVDSQSMLSSCLTGDRITPLFAEIRLLLLNIPAEIQLYWIAAHKGHEGNEIADRLANTGALALPLITDLLPLPTSALHNFVEESTKTMWEREWQACQKGKITKDFFPTTQLPTHFKSLPISGHLSQLITGHSYLNAHLYRLRMSDSPACRCGEPEETISHILLYCPALNEARSHLRASVCNVGGSWPPSSSTLCKNRSTLRALIHFVETCGRFDNPFRRQTD